MRNTIRNAAVAVLSLALLAVSPLASEAQTRGDGTLTLTTATLVSSVAVNSKAAQQLRNNRSLSTVLAVRDGQLRARRGYSLYRVGEDLLVRNNNGRPMARDTRVTWHTGSSEFALRIQTCECPDKDDDDCVFNDTESGTTCDGEPCCEYTDNEFAIDWWGEEQDVDPLAPTS